METTLEDIETAAGKLSAEERIELASRLLSSSLPPADEKLDQYWIDAARRRLSEVKAGKVHLIDGDKVLAKGRAIMNDEF